jgi:DNA-binding transcriptional regulator LsrR (DeoR family)
VAKQLTKETGTQYSRVDVNRMIAYAVRKGFFVVHPPPHRELEEQLVRQYAALKGSIHVVPAALGGASDAVATIAANDAIRLIRELAHKKPKGKPVGVGLVGGRTMQRVAQVMAQRMSGEPGLPEVTLHAVCSGFSPVHPETAPVTFLGYFADVESVGGCVALFSTPAVLFDKYEEELANRIVRQSFEKANEIDLVITSLGAYRDKHNTLVDLATVTKSKKPETEDPIVGDIGYCPYGDKGPLEVTSGYRPVTIFSIEDLVDRAKDRLKEVMLVAGPCPKCEGDEESRKDSVRDDALHPLMTVPELRAWSHVYMDTTTATRLTEQEGVAEG